MLIAVIFTIIIIIGVTVSPTTFIAVAAKIVTMFSTTLRTAVVFQQVPYCQARQEQDGDDDAGNIHAHSYPAVRANDREFTAFYCIVRQT